MPAAQICAGHPAFVPARRRNGGTARIVWPRTKSGHGQPWPLAAKFADDGCRLVETTRLAERSGPMHKRPDDIIQLGPRGGRRRLDCFLITTKEVKRRSAQRLIGPGGRIAWTQSQCEIEPGAMRDRTGRNARSNRAQCEIEPGAMRDRTGRNARSNRAQCEIEPGAMRDRTGRNARSNRAQCGIEPGAMRDRTGRGPLPADRPGSMRNRNTTVRMRSSD
jgi:hypothetical protein